MGKSLVHRLVRSVLFAFTVMFVTWFVTGTAFAQTTGTVRGRMSGPSGAVIPNASVQFSGDGVTQTVKTDGQGRFTANLPPGTYTVQASATGFVTFNRPDVSVASGQASTLDIPM